MFLYLNFFSSLASLFSALASSNSFSISSIALGDEIVARVYPIHDNIAKIAETAMNKVICIIIIGFIKNKSHAYILLFILKYKFFYFLRVCKKF